MWKMLIYLDDIFAYIDKKSCEYVKNFTIFLTSHVKSEDLRDIVFL